MSAKPATRAPDHEPRACDVLDLIELDIPPREPILSPWLRQQDLVMIHAPRGIGKTQIGLSAGLAISSKGGFLGWEAPQARRVLLIDGEMPAHTMQERCRGFMQANNWHLARGMFDIITPDLQLHFMPNLADPDGQAAIAACLEGVEVLILDNLSTLARSGVENEGESWLPIQEWLLGLRRSGVTVILIHHSGKNGTQRGTSRREDVLDVVIGLRRPKDYSATEGCRFELHFEKSRGLTGDVVQPVEASLHSGTDGTMVWLHRSLEDASKDRIVEMLADGLTLREVAQEVGKSKSWIGKVAKQARESGDL